MTNEFEDRAHTIGVDRESARLDRPLEAIQRRWKLIVTTVVLVALVAGGLSALQSKKYTATATLLFRSTDFAQQLFGANFLPASKDPSRDAATNQNLVTTRAVANRTAAALRTGLTGQDIADRVTAQAKGTSDLVAVSAVDESPQRAARIATEFARQFVRFRRQADQSVVNAAGALVAGQLRSMSEEERQSPQGLSLQRRQGQIEILASLQTGNAEVVQQATAPRHPSSPRTKRNIALALVLGVVLGVGIALLADRLDQGIRSVQEVERLLPVPVLAQIPRRTGLRAVAANTGGTARIRPSSDDLDPFRLLRSHLRYFNVDGKVRSLLITSAEAGAGKTTVSIGLAAALTQAGDRVVLVEADLRRPALRARLGESAPKSGLAEVLAGDLALDDALSSVSVGVTAGVGGEETPLVVTVLGAGFAAPNPAELLESTRMRELLDELKERFDVVLVDSAPPLLVSDSVPLLRIVDGVVAVCRIGHTPRLGAERLAAQLAAVDSPLLGSVANDIRSSRQGSYGYGYDGYKASPDREPPAQVASPAVASNAPLDDDGSDSGRTP